MSDKWIGHLGSLHQFRGVTYVEEYSDGEVVCLLCGTGGMTKSARKAHFHGSKHEKNYNQVRAAERDEELRRDVFLEVDNHLKESRKRNRLEHLDVTTRWSRNMRPRISALMLPAWRSEIQSYILEVIETEQGYVVTPIQDKIEVITKLLTKYEEMEITSLLEQALWKARILNDGLFESVQDVRNYVALEEDFDSKAFLNQMKIICGSEVVIPKVINFLGW